MIRDHVLELCATLPAAVEDYPFGDGVAVFKVAGRMFALVPPEGNPAPSVSNATPTSRLSCGR
jgi:predicted DNA-binding protein (MmcQ/YjbR family)